MTTYAEIRDTLKTGDLVLFSGEGRLSRLIQLGTRSKWSHVGMVIENRNEVFLWESTTLSKLKDIDTGRAVRGVQSVYLSDRINTYDGEIAIRPLVGELELDQWRKLHSFRQEVRGRPYEQSKIELAKAAFDLIDGSRGEDLTSLFCSELIAEAFQQIGFLTDDIPSNEYTPADFARLEIMGDVFDSWKQEIIEIEA